MDFFRGLAGSGANSAEPPASVLAEWNKYSAGDIESQTASKPASAAQPTFFSGLQQSVQVAANSATSSMALYGTQSSSSGGGFGFRIPSGTQFVYFAAFIGGALMFYSLALFVFLPILILSPSKFALCFSFGSMCTMAALVMLSGWQASVQHLLSAEKAPFTAVYAGSLFATLYAALAMHSYLLCIVFSITQVVALAYYIMSYFPGGAQGMQFALSMAGRAVLSCFGSAARGAGATAG